MSETKNFKVSVTIAGSTTSLLFVTIIWCTCAAPYNEMREATLDAAEANVYLTAMDTEQEGLDGIRIDKMTFAKMESDFQAKRYRAVKAYERMPFYVKWFAERPEDHIDNAASK